MHLSPSGLWPKATQSDPKIKCTVAKGRNCPGRFSKKKRKKTAPSSDTHLAHPQKCPGIRVLQRNKNRRHACVCVCLFIYLFILRNLCVQLWRVGKAMVFRVGQQAEDPQKADMVG